MMVEVVMMMMVKYRFLSVDSHLVMMMDMMEIKLVKLVL